MAEESVNLLAAVLSRQWNGLYVREVSSRFRVLNLLFCEMTGEGHDIVVYDFAAGSGLAISIRAVACHGGWSLCGSVCLELCGNGSQGGSNQLQTRIWEHGRASVQRRGEGACWFYRI